MSIQGTIHLEGETVFVRYETTFENEPTRQILFWRVDRVVRSPYHVGSHPMAGDVVRAGVGSDNTWSGPGYTVHFAGTAEAERIEREPVPCPSTRGKPSRWYQGRWEKLMAKGWVPA